MTSSSVPPLLRYLTRLKFPATYMIFNIWEQEIDTYSQIWTGWCSRLVGVVDKCCHTCALWFLCYSILLPTLFTYLPRFLKVDFTGDGDLDASKMHCAAYCQVQRNRTRFRRIWLNYLGTSFLPLNSFGLIIGTVSPWTLSPLGWANGGIHLTKTSKSIWQNDLSRAIDYAKVLSYMSDSDSTV